MRKFFRIPGSRFGTVTLIAVLTVVLGAPLFTPYSPTTIDVAPRLSAPSAQHPLGTDELGRDLLSRTLHGGRVTMLIAIGVVLLAGTVGSAIGLWIGFRGGWWDATLMRVVDVALSFPALVLAMALAAVLGPNLRNAMLAVALVQIPFYVRMMRGEALRLKDREFVLAAESLGTSRLRTLVTHVLPNALQVLIVYATLGLGVSALSVASLSFLGLGAQPPTPEWGALVSTGRSYLLDQWWYSTVPGLGLFVMVTALNILGDALREYLDPKVG